MPIPNLSSSSTEVNKRKDSSARQTSQWIKPWERWNPSTRAVNLHDKSIETGLICKIFTFFPLPLAVFSDVRYKEKALQLGKAVRIISNRV